MSDTKYKPIVDEPDTLALIILILSFLGAIAGLFVFGTMEVPSPYGRRMETVTNWPAILMIFISFVYAITIFMLCTRVKNLSRRNKQQEEILIRMAEKFDL